MYAKTFDKFTEEEKRDFREKAAAKYAEFKAMGLCVNMARGNPSKTQLDFSDDIFGVLKTGADCFDSTGIDLRGYGTLAGAPDCRKFFGELLGVPADNIIACGASSLNLMFDYVSQCMTHGAGCEPWCRQGNVKFIAVVPGYDRHFGIAKHFGIELVNAPMTKDGPDMDIVEELIKDESVKGMFCVPKYQNPTGITFSEEVIERLAKMEPAAKDFRVIWDNAYVIHDFYDKGDPTYNIFDYAKKYGHEDNFVEFASTSKITFPGAGVAVIAASDNNIKAIIGRMTYQTISYDKINQIRHVKMFGTPEKMIQFYKEKHAAVLRPKFETVIRIFNRELGGLGVAEWTEPKGGYFISLDVTGASAKKVGAMCKEAGLTLTNIGATYPGGYDPEDRNIRIAPSFPPVGELETAAELLCAAIKAAL